MTMEAFDSDFEKRHFGPFQSPKISKLETLELITDQIIDIATVKGQTRFIDEDRPEDNVSYEESEKRLTYLAFFFAISSSTSTNALPAGVAAVPLSFRV